MDPATLALLIQLAIQLAPLLLQLLPLLLKFLEALRAFAVAWFEALSAVEQEQLLTAWSRVAV
jgi:hypothetical protein